MFETVKNVVTSREFLIGAGTGVTLGVVTGYFTGRRRAVKELESNTKSRSDQPKEAGKAPRENCMRNAFNNAFYTATVVSYDKEWANGTGYYDHATQAELPEIEVGQYFRAIDPGTNRRILGLKIAENKNAVVFERYSQSTDNCFVLVSNLPRGIQIEGFGSSLSQEAFNNFLNYMDK